MQSQSELIHLFSQQPIEQLTTKMEQLEKRINQEQTYIAKHSDKNDANSDPNWKLYKESADRSLAVWDAMKAARDEIKTRQHNSQ